MSRGTNSDEYVRQQPHAPAPFPVYASRIGRQLAALALVTGFAYLIWRSIWSWHGPEASVAWWLAVPALALELSGFACVAVLVWALWNRPNMKASPSPDSAGATLDYDVAIVATDKTLHDLRATLVALQLEPSQPSALVIDHSGRSEIVHLAAEFEANYRVPDITDSSGLSAATAASEHEFFLLLSAGDIPAAGAAGSLHSWIKDQNVGVVQGVVGPTPGVSAEEGPNSRHELTFERAGLNPGLGTRGTGIVTGSGALIRRSAMKGIELSKGPRHSVLWELMPRLAASNVRVIAAAGPVVVAEKPLTEASAVAANRHAQANAGWRLLIGETGVLRARGIRLQDRLALAAWAVRSFDGLRRILLAAIVLGALLSGRSPFMPSPAVLWFFWAPAFVLASAALALLSGGSLRPGDRLRGSVRALSLSVGMVIAINAVLIIRGVSDRFTHALRPLDHNTQIGLTAIALWLLAGSLDSLRLLAWRRQSRRAFRLAATGTAHLDDFGVYVSDITMLGAGLLADRTVTVRAGSTHRLSFSVPSDSGITSLDIPCVVRNVRPDIAGAWRVGVEFYDADSFALNTLAESCAVMPARSAIMGTLTSPSQLDDSSLGDVVGLGQRRFPLRVATLLALAGVVSSTAPIYAQAGAPSTRQVSGIVVDIGEPPTITTGETATETSANSSNSTTPNSDSLDTITNTVATDSSPHESAMPTESIVTDPASAEAPPASTDAGETDMKGMTVVAVCSTSAGTDNTFGTSDDTYGPSVSTLTNAQGQYTLKVNGDACWLSIEPPAPSTQTPAPLLSPTQSSSGPMLIDLGGTGEIVMAPAQVSRPSTTLPRTRPETSMPDLATAALGDLVWSDLNADGVQQADEVGVGNATVTLYNAAGQTVATTTTGFDGSFLFDRLTKGLYGLGVSNLPDGLHVPGADPLSARTSLVSLQSGQRLSSLDVGAVGSSSATARPPAATDLPTPSTVQLSYHPRLNALALPTMVILMMAALLAGSVLFASAQPIRVRRLTSQ